MKKIIKYFLEKIKKWGDLISVVYATLIINGKKKFSQVPALIKDQVRQVLIDLDLAELAEE